MFQNKEYENLIQKEGFVIIPFLKDEELKELQNFYSNNHPNDQIPDMRYGIHMTSWCKDGAYKQKITKGLEQILAPASERIFEHFRTNNYVFIIKNKGKYTQFPIHQDWSVVDESKYMSFNVWIPLQDVNQNTGALWIIKGSHRINRHIRGANHLFPDYNYLSKELKPYMHPMNAKAGEAVIFFHSTIHGSPPNINEKLRKVTCFTVLPKEAPLQIFFQKMQVLP
jgi:ectoine hydroxylase-related dioxygenase (phytanoyl-CoA dioxygenase family)